MTAAADAPWWIETTPIGGSALSRALQSGEHTTWMPATPASEVGWRTRVDHVRNRFHGGSWLDALSPALSATGRGAERLQRAASHGVVITTGQQPGLYGGPLYTLSKAMSALAMADALEASFGVPVAPVFWAATDDADWREAAETWVADHSGLHRLSLSGPATDGVAMSDVPLGPIAESWHGLTRACGSGAAPHILEAAERAYVPHATIGGAYVQYLRSLLEPLGVAVLDASHPALRRAADPVCRRALTEVGAITRALETRDAEMQAAGARPQVDTMPELSLVFHTVQGIGGRSIDRVRTRVAAKDAAQLARSAETGTLGPNVLLRPVVESQLLPTVAYHAGPGEYAYFAQVTPVADALGVAPPAVVPRWSGRVRVRRADHDAERLGLSEELLRDAHRAEQHIARAFLDDSARDALERLRVATDTQVDALRRTLESLVGVPSTSVVEGLGIALTRRVDRFERRLLAAIKQREGDVMRRVAAIRALRAPNGASPERVLNATPLLARYGVELLHDMRDAARVHADRVLLGR